MLAVRSELGAGREHWDSTGTAGGGTLGSVRTSADGKVPLPTELPLQPGAPP